ncbi:MAG: hypothetical protein ABTD50_19330 [Polyangiaceae bacterium]|jgi:hypothetical protein
MTTTEAMGGDIVCRRTGERLAVATLRDTREGRPQCPHCAIVGGDVPRCVQPVDVRLQLGRVTVEMLVTLARSLRLSQSETVASALRALARQVRHADRPHRWRFPWQA